MPHAHNERGGTPFFNAPRRLFKYFGRKIAFALLVSNAFSKCGLSGPDIQCINGNSKPFFCRYLISFGKYFFAASEKISLAGHERAKELYDFSEFWPKVLQNKFDFQHNHN